MGLAKEKVGMPVEFGSVAALPAAAPEAEYRYGHAPSQFARLWLPAAAATAETNLPVVVLVHGGCWLERYDLTHVSALAAALAMHGFAVWVPEYRRVGEEGGGWPGTANDIKAAVSTLRAVQGVDLQQVLLVGHSAGGQLALWAASQARTFASEGITVQGVVGLAAITDLDSYARGSNSCQSVTPRFMGGMPEDVPELYAAASPVRLDLQIPTILLHGSADPLVPVTQSGAVKGAEPVIIEGAGHFDLIHPGTGAFASVLAALVRLLEAAP
jgi:acetyl esterase/lipase